MNEQLISVYVKLVQVGKRSLEENDEGIPLVPYTIIEEVRAAIENA